MNSIVAIADHELRRMFKSPLAWVILAVVQFLLAQIFFKYWEVFETRGPEYMQVGLTEIIVGSLYQSAAMILMFVAPFVTMRGFSEERRLGTIRLLLSSPVSLTQLVLGKFFSIFAFFLLILAMITLMPLAVGTGTQLDYWQLGSAVIGMSLLLASFTAIGLFISSLTASTAISAIATFGVLFLLWLMSLAAGSGAEQIASILGYLSILTHYSQMVNGVFNTADVFYYLILTGLFLLLTIWRLHSERVL